MAGDAPATDTTGRDPGPGRGFPPGSSRGDGRRGIAGRTTATALRALARLYPRPVTTSDELARALAFLETRVAPETVVRAGYGVALVVAALGLAAVVALSPGIRRVVPVPGVAALPPVAAAALGTAHAVHRAPVVLAAARRTRALGDAPGLVSRAVLRMRIAPTVESAAEFAARSGTGPLAAALAAHVRRARGTPRSGLSGFAEEWADPFPALGRAAGLVVAAAQAPEPERARTLDRAMSAVLDGTREEMADFAGAVRGPTTALYAFGVLLPLALVAVLPAARVAGVSVPLVAVVVVYDLALPMVTLCAGGWLLVRRPVAFPPAAVPPDHPDRPDSHWPAVAAGLLAGVVAGALPPLVGILPAWSAPLAAVGVGTGTTLALASRRTVAVHRRVRAVEADLPDALYLVGRRVAEGEAVETAVEAAAGEVGGATGEVLAETARVGRRLRVDVREAFLGEHGSLSTLPSPRTRSAAALLSVAAREGRPAGSAVVATADHLAELATVEQEARRELRRVTDTLAHTAAVFAPLVGGATVALAAGMGGIAPGDSVGAALAASGTPGATPAGAGASPAGPSIPTAGLGTAVGAYVLFLAAALTAISVGLERGFDRALVAHRVGRALLSAATLYLAAFTLAGSMV